MPESRPTRPTGIAPSFPMAASTTEPHDPTSATPESCVRRLGIMRPRGVHEVRRATKATKVCSGSHTHGRNSIAAVASLRRGKRWCCTDEQQHVRTSEFAGIVVTVSDQRGIGARRPTLCLPASSGIGGVLRWIICTSWQRSHSCKHHETWVCHRNEG